MTTPSTQTESLGINLDSALSAYPPSWSKQGLWALPPNALESCTSHQLPCLGWASFTWRTSHPPCWPPCLHLPPLILLHAFASGNLPNLYLRSCHSSSLNILGGLPVHLNKVYHPGGSRPCYGLQLRLLLLHLDPCKQASSLLEALPECFSPPPPPSHGLSIILQASAKFLLLWEALPDLLTSVLPHSPSCSLHPAYISVCRLTIEVWEPQKFHCS